ncbi:hypothetical protein ACIQAA_18685 [Neobacillus sp. NPDC093182]|uniref:hypothetical protein n=1 Tax=Neobacillus sp. NPDC093182 TaxID=3364297 RepID=UPI003800E81D
MKTIIETRNTRKYMEKRQQHAFCLKWAVLFYERRRVYWNYGHIGFRKNQFA